jgi:hypothetical protein
MKINEIISEGVGVMRPEHLATQPGGIVISRDVGGYDRFYHMNRMWMATAMADGNGNGPVDMDSASWVEKYNVQHPYTEAEYNMFRQAEATIPTESKEISPWSKSQEHTDIYKQSPMQPKGPVKRKNK